MGSIRFLVIGCIALLCVYRLGETGLPLNSDLPASVLLASDDRDEGEGEEQPFGYPNNEGGAGQEFGRPSEGR